MPDNKVFTVGTIEEDFKRIGLIAESEAATEPKEEVASDKQPDQPATEAAAAPVTEAAEKSAGADGADEKEVAEGLKLLRKRRLTGKARIAQRKQKMMRRRKKSKLKMQAKRWRKSARGKRFLRKYKQVKARLHGRVPRGKRISLRMGLDRVSDLIEEVSEIVKAIDGDSKTETVKSFANIALIADKLAENYACACDSLEVENEEGESLDLCGAAKHFEDIAADAADVAEALNKAVTEGAEFEGTSEEISEMFSQMLSDVLEGAEIFADLNENSEEAEAEEGEESEEAAEDSEETDTDSDESTDAAEEASEDSEESSTEKPEADEDAEEDSESEAEEAEEDSEEAETAEGAEEGEAAAEEGGTEDRPTK